MNTIRNLLAQTALFQGLVVAFACGLFLLSSASPAIAISGSSTSSPSKGVPNLENIQEKTEDFMYGNDNRMPGMKETQERSAGGLNSVQGGADKDKMLSPEDARGATTTVENMQKGLDKLLGNS